MIKHIRIQNFRSLVDVSVDLDPLTVLIGRSGTGKSNFVHAIRFLRDLLTARSPNYGQEWHRLVPPDRGDQTGWGRLLHIDRPNDPLRYDLEFANKDLAFRYSLAFHPKKGHFDESLRVGDRFLFHHNQGKWVVAPAVVTLGDGDISHLLTSPNQVMLGAIPGLQESTFAYFALRTGIGCYDFPTDVLTGPTSGFEDLDPDMRLPNPGFTDRGENYLIVANRILSDLGNAQKWKRITKSLRAVNRAVTALTLAVPTPDRLDVGHQLNGRVLAFDVRQESEGFRRYLAHMLAFYQDPPKQTLIFEHPESGLHPGALQSLAEELKDCPEEGRGQVILTTHSPQLLDYFPVEAIRVVDIEHQKTRIDKLAPEQLKSVKERLLFPGELLTVDPARLPGQLNEVPG
jgi:predicted ATPase